MPCKCGHLITDHNHVHVDDHWRFTIFPCKKCNCKDFDMAQKKRRKI